MCVAGSLLSGVSHQSEGWESLISRIRLIVAGRNRRPAEARTSHPLRESLSAEPTRLMPATHASSGFAPRLIRTKTSEEAAVEAVIQRAYSEYFRTYSIGGALMNVRMPFGLNGERGGSPGYRQRFFLGGKGTPRQLWPRIDSVLGSDSFTEYLGALGNQGEKVVVFDLESRTNSVTYDRRLMDGLKTGVYPGTPTRLFVYRNGSEIGPADVYNYLYAVAAVGVDCSGFSFSIQEAVALARDAGITDLLSSRWKVSADKVRQRIGMWFFDPAYGHTRAIGDRIVDLRPADIILFRGADGQFKHSAVVESIDLERGLLHYVQSTDWAPESERGVHRSTIRFVEMFPHLGLGHKTTQWLQRVEPAFDGEAEPRYWATDGDRYRWNERAGGGLVVRLKYTEEALLGAQPGFYVNTFEALPTATSSSTAAEQPVR